MPDVAARQNTMTLLEIERLRIEFASAGSTVRAVDEVSFTIQSGETVALVGESGCGKTATALAIARLLPSPPARYAGGEIRLMGRDVLRMSAGELRAARGRVVSYVFQEPGASLNPVLRVGTQIKECLKLHRPGQANDGEVIRLLKLVRIPAPEARLKDYPFQLSGGMQQRVMIAIALASEPKLLVADEPTTALDVTIQAQIMDLLRELRRQLEMAILLITHNLALVRDFADRVLVMYAGQIVEAGPATDLLLDPLHPYARGLVNSIPKLNANDRRLAGIPGTVPRTGEMPRGCRFAARCPIKRASCEESVPPLNEPVAGHLVRCPYWQSPASSRRSDGAEDVIQGT
jgi:peptide/nickel transport system ATP-binding protein